MWPIISRPTISVNIRSFSVQSILQSPCKHACTLKAFVSAKVKSFFPSFFLLLSYQNWNQSVPISEIPWFSLSPPLSHSLSLLKGGGGKVAGLGDRFLQSLQSMKNTCHRVKFNTNLFCCFLLFFDLKSNAWKTAAYKTPPEINKTIANSWYDWLVKLLDRYSFTAN